MIMLRAAASLLALTFAATPAFAESASSVRPAAPGRAIPRSFEPGNFPIPIVPGFSDGREWRGKDRHGRPGRPDRPRRRDRNEYHYGYGAESGNYLDPDRGYFAEGGEARATADGVRYDYDRGYPYDHYRGSPGRQAGYEAASREPYCDMKWTRDRRSGQQVSVRVCRN